MTCLSQKQEWGDGWLYSRVLFGFVSLISIIPRFFVIEEVFGSKYLAFDNGLYSVSKVYFMSTNEAYFLCLLSIIGALGVIAGGRYFHLGLLTWFLCNNMYLASEVLNVKAYDRLSFFICLIFFVSPAYKNDLLLNKVSPYPRVLLMILFSSMYLSTGLNKLLYEPAWLTGEALSYHLNHRWHAGSSLALWLSTKPLIMFALGMFTVVFEISIGILLWFKKQNPYVLFVGVFFHLGILLLMNVGFFSLIVLSMYFVLLEPSSFRLLRTRILSRLRFL